MHVLDGVAEKFKGLGHKLEDIKGVGVSSLFENDLRARS